ncbi:hypothetical protein E2C01_065223 [Portunus trituberculatus]|uniref:Uncharacterized protein n=1 Tax=Portunus trituberculatus TaxID=210409 RepID=A0A5B7HP06_PORTR|nr:hypothetical protein [Portunus trituberculatus]
MDSNYGFPAGGGEEESGVIGPRAGYHTAPHARPVFNQNPGVIKMESSPVFRCGSGEDVRVSLGEKRRCLSRVEPHEVQQPGKSDLC